VGEWLAFAHELGHEASNRCQFLKIGRSEVRACDGWTGSLAGDLDNTENLSLGSGDGSRHQLLNGLSIQSAVAARLNKLEDAEMVYFGKTIEKLGFIVLGSARRHG